MKRLLILTACLALVCMASISMAQEYEAQTVYSTDIHMIVVTGNGPAYVAQGDFPPIAAADLYASVKNAWTLLYSDPYSCDLYLFTDTAQVPWLVHCLVDNGMISQVVLMNATLQFY